MKKLLVSLIKAALYTASFLIIQIAATLGLTLITSLVSGVLFFSMGIYDPGYLLTDNLLSIVTVVSCALTLLFFLIFFGVRGKKFSREVRWHKLASPGYAMLGPLECGFGLSLLSSFALAMIPFPDAWYAAYDETMELMFTGNPLFLAASIVLAAPIVEEVVFRGLVYTRLCRGMKRWLAAILSAVIFGLVHGTLLQLVYTVPMGLLLCFFYDKYRSLWAPIVLHMSFNLAGTVLEYDAWAPDFVYLVLIAIGLFLTVVGLLSLRQYRRDTGLYQPRVKAPKPISDPSDIVKT